MSEVAPEDSVGALLQLTLETVNSVFEQANVELPTRQFLFVGEQGETAHDCEQVSVSLGQIYPGTPGDEAQLPATCDGPLSAVIIVEIVREVPQSLAKGNRLTPPAADKLTATALTQAKDAYLLLQSGLATGEAANYLRGAVANVVAGPPSGGMQATVLTLVVAVP